MTGIEGANQEAIDNFRAHTGHFSEYWKTLNEIAISAMEKQVPRKPEGIKLSYAICKCGSKLGIGDIYCRVCGQKIDWHAY